jgi:hypothetical protein
MKKYFIFPFFLIIIFETCLAQEKNFVQIAQQQFIGDADSLSNLGEMQVGEHTLSLSRWYSSRSIEEVIRTISGQVPADTLAWSDGLVLQMVWTSSEYSHVLALMPESEQRVALLLSSMRLSPAMTLHGGSLNNFKQKKIQTWVIADALKNIFLSPILVATLMLEVRDPADHAQSATFIFSSAQSVDFLVQAVGRALSNQDWVIAKGSQQHRSRLQSRSIHALRPGASLRIDLMTVLGTTFININMLGGEQP